MKSTKSKSLGGKYGPPFWRKVFVIHFFNFTNFNQLETHKLACLSERLMGIGQIELTQVHPDKGMTTIEPPRFIFGECFNFNQTGFEHNQMKQPLLAGAHPRLAPGENLVHRLPGEKLARNLHLVGAVGVHQLGFGFGFAHFAFFVAMTMPNWHRICKKLKGAEFLGWRVSER